jgi:CBS domain-containing protein
LTWLDGKTWAAPDLIRQALVPLAREGLGAAGIASEDIDRYIGVIDARAEARQTGASWMIRSLRAMGDTGSRVERLRALSRAMLVRQIAQEPVHTWATAELTEAGGWRENFLRVEQFMTTDLITAHEDELIDLVASLMNWKHLSQVPVEDADHRLVGLVAVSDLLELVAQGLPEGQGAMVPVREVMNASPITITPDTPTLEAMSIMERTGVSCLVVVKEAQLVGLVTESDFMSIAKALLLERLKG